LGFLKRILAWFEPPPLADEDDARRARLLSRLILVMMLLAAMGCVAGLLEPRNDLRVTLAFYAVVGAWLIGLGAFVRRGRIKLVAWALSTLFWLMIALVTLLFGGLKAQNATAFGVCILLLGSVVGGRAAFSMALASAGWCAFIAWLELSGKLPEPIEPYSPINAWAAVTITVLLTSVLLRASLESLEHMHARADSAARERDEALRRSIQGQKMELVGNLTSGIAHDFNNLLTVMRSVSDVLRRELSDEAKVSHLLDDLDDATSRATLMARQVLSFGRTARSGPETLDLSAVVLDFQSMLPRLLGPGIEITVHAPLGANIEASRAAIEQILLNLVVNSKEAMPEGGALRITVEALSAHVSLVTEDTGVGMDEATQKRLFEPFFTTKASGTGLGLSTVRELTERFAGTISVRSSPGAGARFELQFPRSSKRVEANRSSGQTDRPPAVVAPLRVLLVEDDALVRRSLVRWLNAEGFEVSSAADGKEALAVLSRGGDIGCVISDISMPHLDGEQLATALSTLYPNLPLVLVSGDRAPVTGVSMQGRRAFVPKPLSQRALTEAIAQVLSVQD
jgi:signal transduction histidine kinase